MNNKIELIKATMEDKTFVAEIVAMEDPAEVQAAFAAKGVELTIDQINQIAQLVFSGEAEELNEAEMDAVAGGLLAEITIIASGIALVANIMAEVNKDRKEKGKKTIW